MKGRENKAIIKKKRNPSADLLVCFPSRAHLALLPKAICSPSRPSESNNRRHHHHRRQLQIKKSTGGGGGGGSVGFASPLPWVKNNNEISEPTSPKVTCAGQIKVRHKTGQCKSWQSVMEEIEKIHNKNKMKKKSTWAESLGFKKEIMQFLTCLRNIRFDFRCLGAFPQPDITSDDEDEDDEDEDGTEENSKTVFSKWFMVLQENNNNNNNNNNCENYNNEEENEDEFVEEPIVPPRNALLLMRCRSAPAKSWLEEEENDKSNFDESEKKEEERCVKKTKSLKLLMEEENNEKNLLVMRYENDLYKISTDIAKETWVVSRDPLMSRSTSWKS